MGKNLKNKIKLFIIIIFLIFLFLYPKSNVLSVPNHIEKGDILFCDFDPDFISKLDFFNISYYYPSMRYGYSNDHVAMYIGDNMFIESCPYYWDKKQNKWIGVVTTHIGLINLWGENISYGIINNVTDRKKSNAANWALDKIGQSYSFLECGDLISEAYKNQNVTLCPNSYNVSPKSLINSKYISTINNKDDGFWYPILYLKWYTISLFDYIEDITNSQFVKDIFFFFQSIVT
jgi:hypothetical protein